MQQSIERLHEVLKYDPLTGKLFWKERASPAWFNGKHAGKEALNCLDNGYLTGVLDGAKAMSHRVIWAMQTGEWPDQIDHIDGDRANNKWANLRSVSYTEQSRNRKLNARNKSGVPGVFWSGSEKRWKVKCGRAHVGTFRKFYEAVEARRAAVLADGKFHPNHGRKNDE